MVRAQRRATAQALQLVVVALLSSGVFFKGGFAAPLSNDALEAEGEADAARAQHEADRARAIEASLHDDNEPSNSDLVVAASSIQDLGGTGDGEVRRLVESTGRIARDQKAVQAQEARAEQDDALARREQRRERLLDAKGDQSGAVDAAIVARIEEKDSIRARNKVARATRIPRIGSFARIIHL
jgi:hypothetical protein